MIIKKIIPLILIVFIQGSVYAQTIDQIVKKNGIATCNCFEKTGYIDSEAHFELKLDSCHILSKEDSLKVERLGSINDYESALYDYFRTHCDAYKTKRDTLLQSYADENNTLFSIEDSLSANNKKIMGEYSLAFGHSSPEGGARLYILEDNKFAIGYFGGAQIGHWKIVKGQFLHLIPLRPKYPFAIYGRHNPNIKDSTKIVFKRFGRSPHSFIHLGKLDQVTHLTPVYNKDYNCSSYPSKTIVEGIHEEISLAYKIWYGEEKSNELELFSFQNPKAYNDFVVYGYIDNYKLKPLRVIIDGDKLIFGKNEYTTRRPFEDDESESLIKEISGAYNEFTTISKYYNLGYKEFDEETILSEIYTYNSRDNTYISSYYDCKTEEGKDCYKADDYDNVKVVNKYDVLQNISTSKKKYMIHDESLIYSVCEENY